MDKLVMVDGASAIGLNDRAQIVAAIGAAVATSDLPRAYELADFALSRGIKDRIVYNARALAYQASGRHQEAIADFQQGLRASPRDPVILNAIGMSQLSLLYFADAIRSFDDAIAVQPNNPLTHYRRGLALGMSGEHDAARVSYERAVELDHDCAPALGSLASISARTGKTDEARDYANRALALNPNDQTALLALAILELNAKRFRQAEEQLRPLAANPGLAPEVRSGILGLLGDALDGQERYREAFASYSANNRSLRRHFEQRYSIQRGADSVRNIAAYFEKTAPWIAPEDRGPPDGPRQHVFLLGFMRSGTTLLEQVLASNPNIVALEEKGTLNSLGNTYMTSNEGLDALANIGGEALAQARRAYWDHVRRHESNFAGKTFVDKQPLNTLKLPLIAKLFPDAKVLFALRDPRDVVFSCFRRHFKVNATAFEFLDLADAASFYSSVMGLAKIYREKLPLTVFEHYYEDMIVDFQTRVSMVCDFVGVEWTDSMRDFNKNAPKVDLRSPSARQVQRPLYGEGIGQWRNYAEELAPILPVLAPWVETFGYSLA